MGLSPSKFIIYVEEQERWGIARAPDMGIVMLGMALYTVVAQWFHYGFNYRPCQ